MRWSRSFALCRVFANDLETPITVSEHAPALLPACAIPLYSVRRDPSAPFTAAFDLVVAAAFGAIVDAAIAGRREVTAPTFVVKSSLRLHWTSRIT